MEKKYISEIEYRNDILYVADQLAAERNHRGLGGVDNVYPIPRGGYLPGIIIAQELGLPLNVTEPNEKSLIVDDIVDSGKTIDAIAKGNPVAAIYVKPGKTKKVVAYAKEFTEWLVLPDEQGTGIEDNIVRIFEHIGEDPNRTGLLGTPDRIVRMWKEIFRGYDPIQKPKITVFPNGEDGIVYDSMVVDEGDYYSMCEHHMMPFFGHYWFAYIPNPNGKILGISKIGRVVDYCSARLQVQERLTHDIVEMLTDALGDENPPLGVALVMKGHHLCKEMRGVKKKGIMTSSYLTGLFKTDDALRAELMKLVND